MTGEQKAFIQILADYIHGRPSVPANNNLNWEKVVDYAEEQALSGIVYIQLRDFFKEHDGIANNAVVQLHRGFHMEIYLHVNRNVELKEFSEKCGKVPLALMKGSVIQKCYPEPFLRSMGDIDVIIHTEDRKKTDAVLKGAGYKKIVDNHAVWTYGKDSIQFEIHDHMFYEHLTNDVDYREYFDRIWDHVYCEKGTDNIYIPEENFHFLYLITHLAKHIINKGMGFRTFIDLVFFTQKYGKEMDWKWIQKELEKLKLLEFTKTCFAFCKRWFNVEMPIETDSLGTDFYSEVTAKMFRDGMFGLENGENEAAGSAKEIKHSVSSYWMAAFKLTMRRMFPPYRDMQLVPWYHFVDGRPWLLPVAWMYRWTYVGTHKFRRGKELLMEPFCKREIIEKREKMISDWGL